MKARGPVKATPRAPEVKTRQRSVTEAQWAIVRAVLDLRDEGVRPSSSAIAERLGVTRQVVDKQIKSLARRGILQDVPVTVSSGNWNVTPDALSMLMQARRTPKRDKT